MTSKPTPEALKRMEFQIYDIMLDAMRDITVEDIERWKDMEAAQGVFIPLQRAMIVASRKLWNGEITLEQLRSVAKPLQELCGLDGTGREKSDPNYGVVFYKGQPVKDFEK